jgi:drug/metabolite transporter (DMT)-like permease
MRRAGSVIANDSLLLLTALIWGLAFVVQREGMNYVGPFTYNAVRFALGSLSLVPLILFRARRGCAPIAPTCPSRKSHPAARAVSSWGCQCGGGDFRG